MPATGRRVPGLKSDNSNATTTQSLLASGEKVLLQTATVSLHGRATIVLLDRTHFYDESAGTKIVSFFRE